MILNVTVKEQLKSGEKKLFGGSGLLSLIMLSVSIISELGIDAIGSSLINLEVLWLVFSSIDWHN